MFFLNHPCWVRRGVLQFNEITEIEQTDIEHMNIGQTRYWTGLVKNVMQHLWWDLNYMNFNKIEKFWPTGSRAANTHLWRKLMNREVLMVFLSLENYVYLLLTKNYKLQTFVLEVCKLINFSWACFLPHIVKYLALCYVISYRWLVKGDIGDQIKSLSLHADNLTFHLNH